jgi:hypothetical protein
MVSDKDTVSAKLSYSRKHTGIAALMRGEFPVRFLAAFLGGQDIPVILHPPATV